MTARRCSRGMRNVPCVCACSRSKLRFASSVVDQGRRLLGLKAWRARARSLCRVLAPFSCCDAAVVFGLPLRQQARQLQWFLFPVSIRLSITSHRLRAFRWSRGHRAPTRTFVFARPSFFSRCAIPRVLFGGPLSSFCPASRPHSNQSRAPIRPSAALVVSSCVSSSAPCVRVLLDYSSSVGVHLFVVCLRSHPFSRPRSVNRIFFLLPPPQIFRFPANNHSKKASK